VIIAPGVYRGPVRLGRAGRPGRPIVFRADAAGRNRVVVTNADPRVRSKGVAWTLEDGSLGLYAIPFGYLPGRVLYDGVDLFPYPGLKLYVRLHGPAGARVAEKARGKYGPTDPNAHTMAVAPPVANGSKGQYLDRPDCASWAILTGGPAHVVLEASPSRRRRSAASTCAARTSRSATAGSAARAVSPAAAESNSSSRPPGATGTPTPGRRD
jgi:hypothetical protein